MIGPLCNEPTTTAPVFVQKLLPMTPPPPRFQRTAGAATDRASRNKVGALEVEKRD